MDKKYQLRAKWSPADKSLLFHYPLGIQTKSDAAILAEALNVELLANLQLLGYRIETLKFSVDIDFESKEAEGRFPTLEREWRQIVDNSF